MSRELPEWLGRTDDSAIPARVKLRVYHRAKGRCVACGLHWLSGQYDHVVPLILGGENRETNLQFLCVPCHKAKTVIDVKLKAKVSRVQKRHLGIKSRRRTIPGRKFDGTPIPARWVE